MHMVRDVSDDFVIKHNLGLTRPKYGAIKLCILCTDFKH